MNMPETSNVENRPTASAGMSWPVIFAAINVIALILGFVYWQNNSFREDTKDDINNLRIDTRDDIKNIRVLVEQSIRAIDNIIVQQNPGSSSSEWDKEMFEEVR